MFSILKRTAVLSCGLLVLTATSFAAPKTLKAEVTLYGWPDNSPPGNAIAFPKNGGNPTIHNVATAGGTFAKPGTFATDAAEHKPGTIIYVPAVQKYFIMEDECVQCDSDWNHGRHRHVDLWLGGNPPANVNDVINCEDKLTQTSGTIIVNPAANEPVSTKPLYNSKTNACFR